MGASGELRLMFMSAANTTTVLLASTDCLKVRMPFLPLSSPAAHSRACLTHGVVAPAAQFPAPLEPEEPPLPFEPEAPLVPEVDEPPAPAVDLPPAPELDEPPAPDDDDDEPPAPDDD